MSTVSDSSVKPTTILNSDSRFGTTFLSTKYRKHAVNGEVLMDKSTGELFIKRVSDGKVVSFYQNNKAINDLALDLRMLLLDNPSFKYPASDDDTFYISTNYDLVAINNEELYNLITDNISISGGPEPINTLTFTVSNTSNGFYCRNMVRDVDSAFVEFLSNQYNLLFKEYLGENETYLIEAQKFQDIPNWETKNIILTYDLKVVSTDGSEHIYENITVRNCQIGKQLHT